MKKQQIRLLALVVVIAVAQLACGSPKKSTPVPPQPTVVEQPTMAPLPTNPPIQEPTLPIPTSVPPVEPTPDNPVSESEPYFTENFYDLPANWSSWVFYGNSEGVSLDVDEENLVVQIKTKDTYVYVTYDDYVYKNVYIETEALNRGLNNNNIGLICRYDEDEGWYEASIASNGLWDLYAYDNFTNSYHRLYNGGSRNINLGRKSNVFGLSCVDNRISLFINGQLEHTYTDNTYGFKKGHIGINLSSFSSLPVIVHFDYVSIEAR